MLSRDTGYQRSYGRNPYSGYDRADQSPFLFKGRPDDRLLPMERVVALELDGQQLAFPYLALEQEPAVNHSVNGRAIVVLFQPGTASALDQSSIADSRDVGATGVFDAVLDGQTLTFNASLTAGSSMTRPARPGTCWGRRFPGRWPVRPSPPSCTATTSGSPGPPSPPARRSIAEGSQTPSLDTPGRAN